MIMDEANKLPALAEPKQQPSRLSGNDLQQRLAEIVADLRKAKPAEAMVEIAACLTLVAPSGMDHEDRTEWLKVARKTVGDVPIGALQKACQTTRETVRRVSDLVPSIVANAREEVSRLQAHAAYLRRQIERPPVEVPQIETDIDNRPFSLAELLDMNPFFVSVARRNGWAKAADLTEYDRLKEKERFGTS